jgi:tripartite-type tricarboxylate transporter receptor subunit TctC
MLSRRVMLGAAIAAPFSARAADPWPSKPIRVILPGPAGGLIDVAGRAVSDVMQKELGQSWIIDPRPGANGIMAGQLFLSSPADGYTLYLSVSAHVVLNRLMKAPFDAMTEFKPIGVIGVSTAILCVPPDSPANDIAGFVALAKSRPGKLNYLNSGNGTSTHLVPEQIKIKFGIDVTSIYYKGLPPGVQDLLASRLDLALISSSLAMQHVQAGRLKALAVSGPRRLEELPNVPTMSELGLGDLEVRSSVPLYGHKDLADPIVERINKALNAALADPATHKRLVGAYIEPTPMSPAEAAAALQREHERLGAMIDRLGIKAGDGS